MWSQRMAMSYILTPRSPSHHHPPPMLEHPVAVEHLRTLPVLRSALPLLPSPSAPLHLAAPLVHIHARSHNPRATSHHLTALRTITMAPRPSVNMTSATHLPVLCLLHRLIPLLTTSGPSTTRSTCMRSHLSMPFPKSGRVDQNASFRGIIMHIPCINLYPVKAGASDHNPHSRPRGERR